jgi:hypothetical protein
MVTAPLMMGGEEMSEPKFGEWQPIETAPRNSQEILVYRHDAGVLLAKFTTLDEFVPREEDLEHYSEEDLEPDWFAADFAYPDRLHEPPTKWMPLPPPPEQEKGE